MTRINAVIGLVLILLAILIGGVGIVTYKPFNVQAQAPPTTIGVPAFTERPALQSESNAPTTIDQPAVYLGEIRAQELSPEEQMQILINQERANKGLPPVMINSHLTQAALVHSQDMADHNFCGHAGSNGDSAWERIPGAGYSGSLGGETVACGQTSVQQTFNDWKNSPGHYAILMGQYGEFGMGWANKSGTTYINFWTATFGGAPGKTTPGGGGSNPPQPIATATNPYQPIPTPPLPMPTFTFPWWLLTPSVRPQFPTPVPTQTPVYRPPATVTPRPQQPTQTPVPQPGSGGLQIIILCDAFGNCQMSTSKR